MFERAVVIIYSRRQKTNRDVVRWSDNTAAPEQVFPPRDAASRPMR
jgi:hypothetical protein